MIDALMSRQKKAKKNKKKQKKREKKQKKREKKRDTPGTWNFVRNLAGKNAHELIM